MLRILRAEDGDRPARVLLLSARAGVDDIAHGLAAGADDYVAKPSDAAELVARVARLLDAS